MTNDTKTDTRNKQAKTIAISGRKEDQQKSRLLITRIFTKDAIHKELVHTYIFSF